MNFMTKLYIKNEFLFTMALIVVYLTGTSVAKTLSNNAGVLKFSTFVFYTTLSIFLFLWIKKNGLLEKYGLCKSDVKSSSFLYYIPLAVLSSVNLWFGIELNMPVKESLLSVITMFFVGFLEEIIFRGFLFCALARDGVRSATLISSFTFGVGHIINLFNGSGAGLFDTLCQIVNAVMFGYLFVIIFRESKSLVLCIVSHSVINVLSIFSKQSFFTDVNNMIVSVSMCAFITVYCALIHKLCRLKTNSIE